MEVIGLAAATLLSKYRKMATVDELLERFFFLGKAAVAILLFFIGVPHMVSYLIGWTGACPLLVPFVEWTRGISCLRNCIALKE